MIALNQNDFKQYTMKILTSLKKVFKNLKKTKKIKNISRRLYYVFGTQFTASKFKQLNIFTHWMEMLEL